MIEKKLAHKIMEQNNVNLLVAIVLAVGIIFGWQYFYEKPRLERITKEHNEYNARLAQMQRAKSANTIKVTADLEATEQNYPRILLNTPKLSGSISLKGIRFDKLTLLDYKETTEDGSLNVELLSPSNTNSSYFAEIGLQGNDQEDLPNQNTVWKSDKTEMLPNETITLRWINKNNVEFFVDLMVDENYMFNITQKIVNNSDKLLSFQSYGLINKYYIPGEQNSIVYVGPIATLGNKLVEQSYDVLKDKKSYQAINSNVNWLGFTEKYWLTSFLPDKNYLYNLNMKYLRRNNFDQYQVDFVSQVQELKPKDTFSIQHNLFLGAKKVKLLDEYESKYNLVLFDRTIDFGWFYLITKPLFNVLNFFYILVGNFGLSILIVTFLVKLALFGFSNKSYNTMNKMKKLQPDIEKLKLLYGEDKMKLNQATMALYREKKINPLNGCLPILLQIPIFFSIYKVLNVTIEMRHAGFYGWIKDLSAQDPTNILTLFGMIDWSPPSFMHIGLWPIFMALSMYLQQQFNPPAQDPVQQKVMQFMPLMFLFMFGNFPAGLLIYWTWNNLLSILQQQYVNKISK